MARRIAVLVGLIGVVCLGVAFVLLSRPAVAKENSRPVDRLVSADTDFGFRLLKELVKESKGKNVFISPASISLALSMTYNGAGGDTQKAMASALRIKGLSLEKLNNGSAALLASLRDPGPGAKLSIANSLWARKGVEFRRDFMARNSRFYRAKIQTLDFRSPTAVPTINCWVSDNTGGKIKDIIAGIDALTILFLINAVYFKGTWSNRFDASKTHRADFRLLGGAKKKIQMMSRHGSYRCFRGEGFRAISLPYGKGRLSTYIFLPDRDTGLPALVRSLDAAHWSKWMSLLGEQDLVVRLPRFRIRYEAELQDALTSLGMGIAFDQDGADFRAMTPLDGAYISSVTHKTFVEVNEEGTEAAAATKVEMVPACEPPPTPEFVVDHPFFCAIRDNKTGAILFAGAITDPTQ